MPTLIRSFLALYPDPLARESITGFISCLKKSHPSIRWEHPEKIHITLKFLGDVEPAALDALTNQLRASIPRNGEIQAVINRPGGFPNLRRPNIVWLGFTDPPAGVLSLNALAEEAAAEHGIARERKRFTPHFTIGRVKRGSSVQGLENAVEACSFQSAPVHFTAVRIMESTLTPQGAVHRERARISLVPGE